MKAITDLTTKTELLERKIKEEQSKSSHLESRYSELLNQYEEFSQKFKPDFGQQPTITIDVPDLSQPEQPILVEFTSTNPT